MYNSPVELLAKGFKWHSVPVPELIWALSGDHAVAWPSQSNNGYSWSAVSVLVQFKGQVPRYWFPKLQAAAWFLRRGSVPVAPVGWCSLASGEWICSTLSVSVGSPGHQRAGIQSWGMTGSSARILLSASARPGRGKAANRNDFCSICRWAG